MIFMNIDWVGIDFQQIIKPRFLTLTCLNIDVEVKANPNTFEEDFRNMLFDNDFTDIIFSFPNEVLII